MMLLPSHFRHGVEAELVFVLAESGVVEFDVATAGDVVFASGFWARSTAREQILERGCCEGLWGYVFDW